MTSLELTIKGDVEVLRLQPGDKVVLTVPQGVGLTAEQAGEMRSESERVFGCEVVVLMGVTASVLREEE